MGPTKFIMGSCSSTSTDTMSYTDNDSNTMVSRTTAKSTSASPRSKLSVANRDVSEDLISDSWSRKMRKYHELVDNALDVCDALLVSLTASGDCSHASGRESVVSSTATTEPAGLLVRAQSNYSDLWE